MAAAVEGAEFGAANDGFGADGDVDVGGAADFDAVETGANDADDLEGLAVEGELSVEHGGRSGVFALPEIVADDGEGGAAATVVVRR